MSIITPYTTSTYTAEVYLPKSSRKPCYRTPALFWDTRTSSPPFGAPVPDATTQDLNVPRNIPPETLQMANKTGHGRIIYWDNA
jgi:hypothetical protein